MKNLKTMKKYEEFQKWLDEQGVIAPRIKFPVKYGKFGLVGAGCIEDISTNDAFCFIPTKIIMRSDKIKDTEIGFIIEEFHDDIEDEVKDKHHFYLLIFLLFEHCKGKDSLWYPYFKIISSDTVLPHQWPKEDIQLLEDELLIEDTLTYKEDVEDEWNLVCKIAKKYPDLFPSDKITNEAFQWSSNTLLTRAFGIGLGFTMIVPFADCFNHYNVDSGSEMFCPYLHQISFIDLTNPAFFDAKEYKSKERMNTEFSDYFKAKSIISVRQPTLLKARLQKRCTRYWRSVENREKTLSTPIEEFEDEKAKDIWKCSYSSSTDTEDDEEGSDGEAFDIVDEAAEIIQNKEDNSIERHLKDSEDRFGYSYTFDKQQRRLLVIQDKKQWKKRSFSCSYKNREALYELLKNEYEEKQPLSSDSSSQSSDDIETNGWVNKYYDDSYFTLSTGKYKGYKAGEQVFNCYGSRSNKFLLANYGFKFNYFFN